ncbi:TATA box-binding protein-associated factor RNA polymerase I subunit A isoform X1 [Hippocampus zosterae]|uniref:TATA box-binding protein-associated factor RNA polymerase I subunit A isoform X1 n=1 Tax=Hippocampus zosterae TaxID=109293 RepID=UPI00223DC2FA|nr:TATA box-binding protein-associated factor RNA polymerase I subunit A isoform X1 [Hippocampus zosterae]XP_051908425.1 TATA box-binding protein-associated factor RNA polymerase I subunit A isoform X1 [Hippocampus zosterae]
MDDLENELWPLVQFDELNDSSESNVTKKEKKSKLPLADPFPLETAKETGFHRTTRLCLERIREAMLHHRWQEAAEYMACYPQQLEDTTTVHAKHYKEMIWRISIELLHHHPNSKMDDYNIIYERMKHSGVKHYLMICLEHSFHLLLHGQIENAKRHLSIAESWRYGKESARHYQRTKLIQAYRSLLDYIIWCDKKNASSETNFADPGSIQDMHSYFRQASVNLKDILKHPGVWDPFILSYVEMLEYYDDQEEAETVLEDYAYDSTFSANPNAHVYLYRYLQRHNASVSKLMNVLKVLHSLVPSHELMLDYSSFLLFSEQTEDIKTALGVVLDMLDFACWRTSMDAWKCLKDIVDKLQLDDDWKEVVAEKMAARKEWWPALHFTRFHASEDAVQRPQLMEVKASLAKILCPEMKLTYPAGSKKR